ncbi:MAG: methyltransferase domain-containing protein [Candidatus Eisenbacteria bacterium]|nr:methyltransferase domain-containing protein [Candidatus Eisenbacteria bacterium]
MDRYKASSLRAYDGELAESYDRSFVVRLLDLTVMDDFVVLALGDSLAGSRILDVGCGTGRLLERLADSGTWQLAGSDLAQRMLDVADGKLRGLGIDVELRAADAESALPWPADSFDVVTNTGVLHHLYGLSAALAEMRRVLRPGGRLVVADPCFFTPVRELFNLLLRHHPRDGDFYFYTPAQMGRLLAEDGWRVMVCRRLNWWAFGAVARSP